MHEGGLEPQVMIYLQDRNSVYKSFLTGFLFLFLNLP